MHSGRGYGYQPRTGLRYMDKPRSIALTAVGFVLVLLVLWNAQEGLWVEPGTGVRHKMVLSEMLTGGCPQEAIEAEMLGTGASSCLTGRGSFDLTDIILGLSGLMLFLGGVYRFLAGPADRMAGRDKRRSWEFMAAGGALAAFGLMDFVGLLSAGSSPLDWAEVIGLPLPAPLVDAACIGGGAFMFRHGSIANREANLQGNRGVTLTRRGTSPATGGSQFHGSLEKRVEEGEDFTIGDMRDLLGFDEDPFFAYDPDEVDAAMQICLFCSGTGCEECDWYGS